MATPQKIRAKLIKDGNKWVAYTGDFGHKSGPGNRCRTGDTREDALNLLWAVTEVDLGHAIDGFDIQER